MFLEHYPHEFRGGRIPWPRFWRLLNEVPTLKAIEKMHAFDVCDYLAAAVWGKSDSLDRMRKAVQAQALGRVEVPRPPIDWEAKHRTIDELEQLGEEGKIEAHKALERMRTEQG